MVRKIHGPAIAKIVSSPPMTKEVAQISQSPSCPQVKMFHGQEYLWLPIVKNVNGPLMAKYIYDPPMAKNIYGPPMAKNTLI